MKKGFFMLLLFSACCIGCARLKPEPRFADVYVKPDEQELLEKKALSGDGYAAYRLYLFYTIYKLDPVKGKYWYIQAHQLKESGCDQSPEKVFP